MNRFRIVSVTVLSVALALGIIGTEVACQHKQVVTNVPVGISQSSVQTWFAAAGFFKEAGEYTNQLTQAAVNLHSQFPDEQTYQTTLAGLGRLAQIGIQGSQFLEQSPQHWDQTTGQKVQGIVSDFSTEMKIAVDDGLLHIKDGPEKEALKTTVALLDAGVKTALAFNVPAGGQ